MRKRNGQEAEHGQEGGHQNSSQPSGRAAQNRIRNREALITKLIEMANHDDAIEDSLAKKSDEPNGRRNAQRYPGEEQGHDTADEPERDVYQDQERAGDAFEGIEEKDKDEECADRNDDREALHGSLLILKLAAPGHKPAM